MKNKNKILYVEKEEKKYDKNHTRNQILVNLITSIRALGTIAIIPIFFSYGALATALSAMGFFITDFIDGHLARKLHVESFFGSLLDALSDKAFGIVCLLLLSTLNPIFLVLIGIELGIFTVNYQSLQRGNNAKSSKEGKAKTLLLAASIVGSYFCYAAPAIKEVLNYINISSFNKLLEVNPTLLSTILAIPSIGASLYVAKDYDKKAKTQDIERQKTPPRDSFVEQDKEEKPLMSLEEIAQKRADLVKQKEEAVKKYQQELKSRSEILHDLFDTDFYMENKDKGIKQLLYKKKGSE